eukprot:TRINITY_DN69676_c0_g1_i1.p1 TRINITY_DN69676_c0_g1~~TRINITY_DN69676_c0_g1_i1.p1  ORF type:complete len:455 (+),score=47.40 TRINITY_DN69676_c0_g1_i1:109-1473(+)
MVATRKGKKVAKRLAGFPAVSPERSGLNALRLREFRAALRRETNDLGSLPGAAHIVLHAGRCVFAGASGWANLKGRTKFRLDTICALHGATKPLVVAAFMSLVDEGKVSLSDPVAKYLPFPEKVAVSVTKSSAGGVRRQIVAAKHRATLQHLLTNTVSMTEAPALRRVRKGAVADLHGLCSALAESPLLASPGSRYDYGMSMDVLGRVCEVASGEPLEAFVRNRVLEPLGMKDTHFVVPQKKQDRIAPLYDSWQLKSGKWKLAPWTHPESAPGIASSSGGILSYNDAGMYGTANDYARFVQMLLDGGVAPGGTRVLSVSTAKAIWLDSLAQYSGRDGRLAGWKDSPEPDWAVDPKGFWDRNSWSLLNTHLVFGEKPRRQPARRSTHMWMGGGGGAFWIADKKRKLAAISFTQCFGGRTDPEDGHGPLARDITPTAIQAADEGQKLRIKKRKVGA